ncbi:MAG: radical SAM protein [Dehalococcoidia bacterium]|nr:radical SAM protein [Dehalococcoidia bacterium]
MSSIIYGPVPSWRLGRSLGIDLLPSGGKACSFNCSYCQLGKTVNLTTERGEFISFSRLIREMEKVKEVPADYVTFSGRGEPSLASNLSQAIELARDIFRLPTAVLTNSSLMAREDVRYDLARADVVVAKLDAHEQELFQQMNCPGSGILFSDIVAGIRAFRKRFKGKLCLQIMFTGANRNFAGEIALLAGSLSPDEIQLNTPLRPCAVQPLSPEEMASIKGKFDGLGKVVMVYEADRPEVTPLDLQETLRRRIKL